MANLLLAALDSVSARRMEQYGAAVDRVGSPTELVDVAMAIFREDLDAGYVAVLVEMIAGASSTPGLGPEVSARLGPWFAFAERAVATTIGGSPLDSVLPPGDVAYAIVALYLGLEMLTHLDGDPARALGLFAHARNLAGLLEALGPPPVAEGSRDGRRAPVRTAGAPHEHDRHRARRGHRRLQLLGRGHGPRAAGRRPSGADPHRAPGPGARSGRRFDVRPLDFDDPLGLVASLSGATTLYNTYWVRFARRSVDHERAVANSRALFHAARRAGVQRIVHVSITHPSINSPWPYFRGKALVERALAESGVSYAIVRPAILFGGDGVLLNNIAWLLRRLPVFAIGGRGDYRIRGIHVDDLARLCVAKAAETLTTASPMPSARSARPSPSSSAPSGRPSAAGPA